MTAVYSKKTGASFARGASEQAIQTPAVFLDAVQERFGRITWDIAAHSGNAVTLDWYGPNHPKPSHRNALSPDCDWPTEGVNWLNPEFGNIDPWVEKCAKWKPHAGGLLLVLTPASVSTNWFADHVFGKAMVLAIRPRLTFVGHTHSYPKDLILSVWGTGHGFNTWRWDE
jgi:hypothetical protein